MKSPWFSLNHISHLATVRIRVVRLGSFQNLYLSFAIVEITHGVTANRDVIIFSLCFYVKVLVYITCSTYLLFTIRSPSEVVVISTFSMKIK